MNIQRRRLIEFFEDRFGACLSNLSTHAADKPFRFIEGKGQILKFMSFSLREVKLNFLAQITAEDSIDELYISKMGYLFGDFHGFIHRCRLRNPVQEHQLIQTDGQKNPYFGIHLAHRTGG